MAELIPLEAKEEKKKEPKKSSKWIEEKKIGPFKMDRVDMIVTGTLLVACIVMYLIRTILHPVIVRGISMEPTLHDGDVLFTTTSFKTEDIDYGNVVVFDSGEKWKSEFIKRVEGLPGDRIKIEDGRLYRNGEIVEENFELIDRIGNMKGEITLSKEGNGEFFVLGDNRNNSKDSRYIGPIAFEKINGIIKNEKPVFSLKLKK